MTPAEFVAAVRRNRPVARLIDRLPALGLPQGHLAAGCLFQTVWNLRSGRPPDENVRDHDVLFFDPDLSWAAEDRAVRAAAALGSALGARVEARNQARVHLWYEARFGEPCPPLPSARAGIDRFLVAGTAVGVELATGAVYAPFGLDALAAGELRVNPLAPRPALFRAKAADYRARWPWLRVEG